MSSRSARRRARAEARYFALFTRQCENALFSTYSATGRAAWEAAARYGEADPWAIRYRRAADALREMDAGTLARRAWETGEPLPFL